MLARAVGLNVLGTAMAVAFGFVGAVLAARWLGPTDRGLFALMWLVGSLAVAIFGLGVPTSVTYYVSRGRTDAGEVLGAALAWAVVLACVFVPTTWILRDQLADLLARGEGGDAWVLVGVLVPTVYLGYVGLQYMAGTLRFGWSNALRAGSRAIYVLLLVLLLYALDLGVAGALAAVGGGWLAVTVVAAPLVAREAPPRLSPSAVASVLRYGLLVLVGTISMFASYRLDLFILQHFRPLDDVGIYAVAQSVAETVTILALGFAGSMLPLIATSGGEEQRSLTAKGLRNCSLLGAAGAATLAVLAPPLIPVAFGEDFSGAVTPLLILLPSMWFLGMALTAGSTLRGFGRPGLASALAGVSMIATVALDLVLIPAYGVTGAAIASASAYVLFGLGSLAAVTRVVGLPFFSLVLPTRSDLERYRQALLRAANVLTRGRVLADEGTRSSEGKAAPSRETEKL